jgi:hypothetical protein
MSSGLELNMSNKLKLIKHYRDFLHNLINYNIKNTNLNDLNIINESMESNKKMLDDYYKERLLKESIYFDPYALGMDKYYTKSIFVNQYENMGICNSKNNIIYYFYIYLDKLLNLNIIEINRNSFDRQQIDGIYLKIKEYYENRVNVLHEYFDPYVFLNDLNEMDEDIENTDDDIDEMDDDNNTDDEMDEDIENTDDDIDEMDDNDETDNILLYQKKTNIINELNNFIDLNKKY